MPEDPGERVAIARLGRPHGVQGAIAAHADGPTLGTLEPGEHVTVRVRGADRALVVAARRGEAPRAILEFRGIETRDGAALLTGGDLLVGASRLPEPDDPDTFYVRDLIGFAVHEGDLPIGAVADVHPGPANDCLMVRGERGDVLVPFTRDAVVDVDEDRRVVVLRADLLGDWDTEAAS